MILIILFTYFYTAVQFNPIDQADNLKKYGGFVPGIRPGRPTAAYLDRVLTHHSAGRVVPCGDRGAAHGADQRHGRSLLFRGTSLLIVVGVALDTMQQMESQLLMRHYEGFSSDTADDGRSAMTQFSLILLGPPGRGRYPSWAYRHRVRHPPHIHGGHFALCRKEPDSDGPGGEEVHGRRRVGPRQRGDRHRQGPSPRAGYGQGLLMDGFPRTIPQAEALDEALEGLGRAVSKTVVILVDEDDLCGG